MLFARLSQQPLALDLDYGRVSVSHVQTSTLLQLLEAGFIY